MKRRTNKHIEEFKKQWFAPPEETTLMNWSGLIADTRSLFGGGYSAQENELYLKQEMWKIIERELKIAYKIKE